MQNGDSTEIGKRKRKRKGGGENKDPLTENLSHF